jgi:hypothetical protein
MSVLQEFIYPYHLHLLSLQSLPVHKSFPHAISIIVLKKECSKATGGGNIVGS